MQMNVPKPPFDVVKSEFFVMGENVFYNAGKGNLT